MRARFRFFPPSTSETDAALSTKLGRAAGTDRLGMVIVANRTGVGTSTTRVASSRPPDRPFLAVAVRTEGSSTRPKYGNPEDAAAQQRHDSESADTAIGSGEKPELSGDHRAARAEEPAGVVHQQQIVAQREALEHPFTRRIELPATSIGQSHSPSSRPATAGSPPRCRPARPARRRLGPALERAETGAWGPGAWGSGGMGSGGMGSGAWGHGGMGSDRVSS